MNNYKKWQVLSPIGLALIGLGASLLGHSIVLKSQDVRLIILGFTYTNSLVK